MTNQSLPGVPASLCASPLKSATLYYWLPSWGNALVITASALVGLYLTKTQPAANMPTLCVGLAALLSVSLAFSRARLFPLRAFRIGSDVVAAHTPEQALQVAFDEVGDELRESGSPVTLKHVLVVGDKELDAPLITDDGADAPTLRADFHAARTPRYLAYCPKD